MLKPLTSFRFFAALLVFIYHAEIYEAFFKKFYLGVAGVSFFFTLSGFILTYSYLSKFEHFQLDTLKSFFVSRFAKVYPVHLLTFVLFIPLAIDREIEAHGIIPWHSFIPKGIINLTLLQSFFPTLAYSFNGVSWSISVEVMFYIALPFILLLINKKKHILVNKVTFGIALSLWILVFCFAFVMKESKINEWFLYILPFTRIFDFIIGSLLGYVFVSRHKPRYAHSIRTFTLLEITSLLLLLGGFFLSPLIPLPFRYSWYFIPFWCLIIFTFAYQTGYVSRLLSKPLFVWLGNISFSFYMIHFMTITYLKKYISISHLSLVIIELIASLLLSGLVYTFYEEPLRKKIKRLFIPKMQKVTKDNDSSIKLKAHT